jgi:hypothetical protein
MRTVEIEIAIAIGIEAWRGRRKSGRESPWSSLPDRDLRGFQKKIGNLGGLMRTVEIEIEIEIGIGIEAWRGRRRARRESP